MKKTVSAILALVMLLGIVSCGKGEKAGESGSEGSRTESVAAAGDTEAATVESTGESADECDELTWVNGSEIYLNYMKKRAVVKETAAVVFYNTYSDLVTLQYDNVNTFDGALSDVFDYLNDGSLFSVLWKYSDASINPLGMKLKIDKQSEQNVKMGGLDTVRIKGSLTDRNGRACHVYGYTFIMDSVPCFLGGFVFTENQEQSLIASIDAEVDAMIKTVRNEY